MSPSPAAATASTAFRHRGLTRALARTWFVVHALIVGVVPVLDARLEAGAQVIAHWEDGSRSTCPALHDTSVCGLCQLIGTGAADLTTRVGISTAAGLAVTRPGQRDERPVGTLFRGALSTRAPPIV